MAIKIILGAASRGSATMGTIELACQLAQRFRAHLEGYHVLLDPQAALASMAEDAGLGLIAHRKHRGRRSSKETRSLFAKVLVAARSPWARDRTRSNTGRRVPGGRRAATPRFLSRTAHASSI